MKSPGKEIRLRRILQADGRTVIIPLDHGLEVGPIAGFEFAEKTLRSMIDAGADAILTSFGAATRYAELFGKVGLLLRVDGGVPPNSTDPEAVDQMWTVEDAVRLGADAVVINGYIGGTHAKEALVRVGRISGECARWQMPLVVEMFMGGSVKITTENVAAAARIAAEHGADLVKTHLVGDASSYATVVERCFVPIVILGGEKTGDDLAALKWARTAVESGAAGTCIGRNVWQHRNPTGVVRALRAIVHEGASAEKAAQVVEGR